jgi:hypothetical protein
MNHAINGSTQKTESGKLRWNFERASPQTLHIWDPVPQLVSVSVGERPTPAALPSPSLGAVDKSLWKKQSTPHLKGNPTLGKVL